MQMIRDYLAPTVEEREYARRLARLAELGEQIAAGLERTAGSAATSFDAYFNGPPAVFPGGRAGAAPVPGP